MKSVAYYRSRPSEPEASELALHLQRKAVHEGGYDVVAEFIECEGEDGSEAYPAYVAAIQAACAISSGEDVLDVNLIIAAHAGIGMGMPFQEPKVEGANRVMYQLLRVSCILEPPEIMLPAGAPSRLCLYADCRPRQLVTLLYLCNVGPDALLDAVVSTDTISMNQFVTLQPSEESWVEGHMSEQRWDELPPNTGVLVGSLDHSYWDFVSRYRLTYVDLAGQRCKTEAYDRIFNIHWLSEELGKRWVAFEPFS